MNLSRNAKLVCGITVLSVPTIMYGGLTLLGLLTSGRVGLPPSGLELNETQMALWRAGHAHAGVWLILSLIVQMLLDVTQLNRLWEWIGRVSAPLAAVVFSAGFFGLAFLSAFKWVLYAGAVLMGLAVLLTGVGLLRNL